VQNKRDSRRRGPNQKQWRQERDHAVLARVDK
jgi:hypothetical protein